MTKDLIQKDTSRWAAGELFSAKPSQIPEEWITCTSTEMTLRDDDFHVHSNKIDCTKQAIPTWKKETSTTVIQR